MKTILFLVHRIPYPPNKGDKIRSYHLLRFLSARFRVLLGAFVDAADDWRFVSEVEALSADTCLVPLRPRWATARSLSGLLTGEPLTIPYYRDRRMSAWVDAKLTQGVDAALVFSSSMAPYVERWQGRRVVDFVDLDSEKWRQYGAARFGPVGALYRREGRTLGAYEERIARAFDQSLFVSSVESEPLLRRAPDTASRVRVVANGVDAEFFDPDVSLENPYDAGRPNLVFTGAMDYRPNVDAVCWFAAEVWPRVLAAHPQARFHVVGSRPVKQVRDLASSQGISVSGTVPDIRPYLRFASLAVAPMRLGRGIQNKVLEAMAMALPIVGSSAAVEGLTERVAANVDLADGAAATAAAVERLLGLADRAEIGRRNRRSVLDDYSWDGNLLAVSALLDNASADPASTERRPAPEA